MRKDRNSPDSHNKDHSLPRSKILRGRKNFQRLFEKSTVLNSNSLQFRYRIYTDPEEGCLIGFAAPKKKISKAARRNRAKRLIREAYRLNQAQLSDLFATRQFGFHGLFMANRDNLSYSETEADMIRILGSVRNRLKNSVLKEPGEPGNTEQKSRPSNQ
jgi:ribonuclease P protein component